MKTKLKPFDLEAALKGAAVVTREGKEVSELVYLKTIKHPTYRVIASIDGGLAHYSEQGTYHKDISSEFDLFMKPQQVTKWVNIYKNSSGYHCGNHFYLTKEQALENGEGGVDTIQITFEA